MSTTKVIKSIARAGLEFANTYKAEHAAVRDLYRKEHASGPRYVEPERRHVDAAIAWIKRAQDAAGNGGVSWGYRARRPVRTSFPMGWVAAYPETTGYIIPTMLRYGALANDPDSVSRARRMIDWEMSIQLPDGGFQGGIYGDSPVNSSTFVTGQVLFGLVAGHHSFGTADIVKSAVRGGDWLLSCLDDRGRFVRGHSDFCAPGAKAYEVRTALAMAELGDAIDARQYTAGASSMADYALSCQLPNGWFRENDLNENDRPLTHTIGYVLEGLHGIGQRLRRQDCLDAVARTLRAIAPLIRPDGFLPGRLRNDWTPAVDWACLTGSSQIGGVFVRMYQQTGRREFLEAGKKLLGFVAFTQDLLPGAPGLDGAIRGSYPFEGEYGKWCTLNWATKFFCDSVLDYLACEGKEEATLGSTLSRRSGA